MVSTVDSQWLTKVRNVKRERIGARSLDVVANFRLSAFDASLRDAYV
jgi:hypothetical protein